MEYYFGNECVCLNSQSYRSVYINYLTRLTLFGNNYDTMVKGEEIVSMTKRVVLIHISSCERIKEIFSISGLSGVEFKSKDGMKWHTCCGKVNTRVNGRNRIGYIINERYGRWIIKLVGGNELVRMKILNYNKEDGIYIYPTDNIHGERYITQYWPVRFLIRTTGKSKYTLNCVTFDLDGNILVNDST